MHRMLISVLMCFMTQGCAHRPATPSDASLKSQAEEAERTAATVEATSPCKSKDHIYKGDVNYEGPLGRTKGAQLTINSPEHGWAILQVSSDLKKQDWSGRTVRVTGHLCVYVCPPIAQCLTSGSIPLVTNVRLDVIEE